MFYSVNIKVENYKDGKIVKGYGLLQSNVFGSCEISLF